MLLTAKYRYITKTIQKQLFVTKKADVLRVFEDLFHFILLYRFRSVTADFVFIKKTKKWGGGKCTLRFFFVFT